MIHVALKRTLKLGLVVSDPADAFTGTKTHLNEMQTGDQQEINRFLETAKGGSYDALFHTALFH